DPDRLADTLRDQLSLGHLANLGERLQRDAIALIDRAAFDGEEIPSVSFEAEISFEDDASRVAFMKEYVAAIKPVLKKYGVREGERYRVATAVYPELEDE
ncbi:MAG: hypothetical protein P8Y95_12750, partial [Gammaproteobacteria bacterium]